MMTVWLMQFQIIKFYKFNTYFKKSFYYQKISSIVNKIYILTIRNLVIYIVIRLPING